MKKGGRPVERTQAAQRGELHHILDAIEHARVARGLSMAQLAGRTGVHLKTYENWAQGRHQVPEGVLKLEALARLVGLELVLRERADV